MDDIKIYSVKIEGLRGELSYLYTVKIGNFPPILMLSLKAFDSCGPKQPLNSSSVNFTI